MAFELKISKDAQNDIDEHKKSGNKSLLRKIAVLLTEICDHPYEGTGKPEPLKHQLAGKWSRRINNEDRIVYSIEENFAIIHSAKGHY
ncbi:MAG: hypothetical protein RLZZ175_2039 [Bacteroidota bacterium]|jgi:toxin YoeB